MQKSKLYTTKLVCSTGMLIAMSIIFERILRIEIGQDIRISLAHMPIILCGLIFGPIAGLVSGFASDMLGCMISGYAPNPLINVTACLMGLVPGLLWMLSAKRRTALTLVAAILPAYILGPLVCTTTGLTLMLDKSLTWQLWSARFILRLPTSSLNIAAGLAVIVALVTSGALDAVRMPNMALRRRAARRES